MADSFEIGPVPVGEVGPALAFLVAGRRRGRDVKSRVASCRGLIEARPAGWTHL